MITRRKFVKQMIAAPALASLGATAAAHTQASGFYKDLQPLGRRLELENYYVWCNTPIDGPDGKVHVFFSRWKAEKKMGGWLNGCEIAHAIAESPEEEFRVIDIALAPRPGQWDSTTCHNPHIQFIDNKYCLFYMGNSNGKTDTKRIGLATSNSLDGPWKRSDSPLLLPGESGAWDDHCTTNPAFVKHANGEYWLYYKSWSTAEYLNTTGPIRGNRKYGVAFSKSLEGPYRKYEGNPVIDFSSKGNNRQFEDAFVWRENGKFNMLARDMGIFSHEAGLYLESQDGLKWTEPVIAYNELKAYAHEPPAPEHLKRYGRLERPQLLIRNGKPAYLFTAAQGGKYMTSSAFVLKINS